MGEARESCRYVDAMKWDRRPLRGPEGVCGRVCVASQRQPGPRFSTSVITAPQFHTDRSETPLIPRPSRKILIPSLIKSQGHAGRRRWFLLLGVYLFILCSLDGIFEPELDGVDAI